MKYIIALCCCLIGFSAYAQRQAFIKLSWDKHFKGEPNYNSPTAALTSMYWNLSYESTVYRNRVELKFKHLIDVNTHKSWVKPQVFKNELSSALLLRHEQGHMNIHLLMYLEAETQIVKRKYYQPKTFKQEIRRLSESIYNQFQQLQNDYDADTDHGRNIAAQEAWEEKIDAILRQNGINPY